LFDVVDLSVRDVVQQLKAVIAATQSIRKSQKMKKMLEVSKTFLVITADSCKWQYFNHYVL